MAKTERVQIYIDGGNFHHLVLKRMGIKESGFEFEDFAAFLASGRRLADGGKRYYVGTVREREGDIKSREAMSQQTRFFSIMESFGWQLKTSRLVARMETVKIDERVIGHYELKKMGVHQIEFERTREKGIDVKLAVDCHTEVVMSALAEVKMSASDTMRRYDKTASDVAQTAR